MSERRMEEAATVPGRLFYWSKTDPDRPAYIFRTLAPDLRARLVLTRENLFTLASRCAAILRRAGIKQGDVVCNTLPNSPERLLTDLGIMLAGAVVMNGGIYLADGEDLLHVLNKGQCVALVGEPKAKDSSFVVLQGRMEVRSGDTDLSKDATFPSVRCPDTLSLSVHCPGAPDLRLFLSVLCGREGDGQRPLLARLEKEKESFVAEVKPDDLAFFMSTSGSTGFSKSIPRSHAEFLTLGEACRQVMDLTSADILYNDGSLGWLMGAPCDYLASGHTRVMFDTAITPTKSVLDTWKVLAEDRCTVAILLPPLVEESLAKLSVIKDMGPKLRTVLTGAQPVGKHLMEIVGRLAERVVVMYGSTEVGPVTRHVITVTNKGDYQDGNSGLPLPGVALKIVDDKGQEVKCEGQTGEVVCRAPTLFSSQRAVDQAMGSAAFTPDGWFRTLDVGYKNDRGEIHVICRKSNAILCGMHVLYPGWLETRMARCPGVQSIIIVPVPDPSVHQELCACVLPEPGSSVSIEKLRDFYKTLFVANDGFPEDEPRYCAFFDSFPKTKTGKPDRKAILVSALRSLGLEHSQSPVIADSLE